jgi:hypothetical protein
MRLKILVIALLATSACATSSSPTTPSSGPWRFSGTVSGMDGVRMSGPIAGAELTVVSGVNVNAKVRSDASGHYTFDNLDEGRFTVAIAAPGYVSAAPIVDLYRDIEANFVLKPQ